MKIIKNYFGTYKEREVYLYELCEENFEVSICTLGACIVAIKTPDTNGVVDNVNLWHVSFEDYVKFLESGKAAYFGSQIGRVANRIANAQFTMDRKKYNIEKNERDKLYVHGGYSGFHKKVWEADIASEGLLMTLTSPEGDGGFPGELVVKLLYKIKDGCSLSIQYWATTTAPTPINLSVHPYFNLGGVGKEENIHNHTMQVFADYYTPFDEDFLPTGRYKPVMGTKADLRQTTQLEEKLLKKVVLGGLAGLVYNYHINRAPGLNLACRVTHPPSGRILDVYTDQVGLQTYTGNHLHMLDCKGSHGKMYEIYAGLCLMGQNHPDAINNWPTFPDCVLRPGNEYRHETIYKFHCV